MDGSAIEYSDSDSGDSWTIFDNNSNYADDAPDTPDHPTASITPESHDKDEDTDGISIITDSEPESPSPCQISYEHYLTEEHTTVEHPIPTFIPVNTHLSEISHDSNKDDTDFLGDSNGKHKTYVHRRNKRLSTVLNIIMLGSVITAAGVAIGHMWGARTDCSTNTTPNINKILSNLYKLQEENAYLKSKLKELTFLNMQTNQKTAKYNKCKKTFEEPLVSHNSNERFTKCVDDKKFKSHMAEASEKMLLESAKNDGQKWILEQKDKIYKNLQQKQDNIRDQNNANAKKKSLIDDEYLNGTKDLKYERKSYADSLKYYGKVKEIVKDPYISDVQVSGDDTNQAYKVDEYNKVNLKDVYFLKGDIGSLNILPQNRNTDFFLNNRKADINTDDSTAGKTFKKDKIMKKKIKKIVKDLVKENGDSDMNKTFQGLYVREEEWVKLMKDNKKARNHKQFESNESTVKQNNDRKEEISNSKERKLKRKREIISDEDIIKDDRYTGQRKKQDRKKHDRQQSQKKNKRRNKYEQWEMKGGILNDYEISETSIESDNFNSPKNEKSFNIDKTDKIVGTDEKTIDTKNTKGDTGEINWLDQRASLRKHARQRLQQEMFGNSTPNSNWYFRRMRIREQNREKADHSMYKKLLKRNMNYKLKH